MAYYYLNKMNNTYNQYKYHYLDHIESTIDMRQNYWDFAIKLFSINDFKLPPGCLVANLEIPYQQIKDIGFYLASDQSKAKETVKYNKQYSHIYESMFNVDISSNQFFKQDINNTKINCSINLEIDPQVIKSAGLSLDQEALDTLIVETSEQRWDFSMYYTNTEIINKNQTVANTNGYFLDSGHECANKISLIDVSANNYLQNTNSINELVSFSSDTNFQIIQAKVKFYYWLKDETECKTLETNLSVDRTLSYQNTIKLDQNSNYDFINNKVVWDVGGISGFYIPKYSHGYYELEILLNQENNTNKFIIKNDFAFIKNINSPHITMSKVWINSLEGFERIKWNG